MRQPLRLLILEDQPAEAALTLRLLQKGGIACQCNRVEAEEPFRDALAQWQPDLILSDFSLPQFDGLSALKIAGDIAPDVPFIFVSGTIGEERAIVALQHGAVDYVLKTNLARLVPAVQRALEHAELRRVHEARIGRLTRVLKMLSGVNGAVARIGEREELLTEACRLAVSVGGYSTALVALMEPGAGIARPVASTGLSDEILQSPGFPVSRTAEGETSIISRVLRTGEAFVCNSIGDADSEPLPCLEIIARDCKSVVALPLTVDDTVIGVLSLAARESGTVSDEELSMLREVAANLSFALQYQRKDSAVRYLSYYDAQTGLAQRALFCERLGQSLARQTVNLSSPAIVAFDIEQLSLINDSLGRHTGDALVQHVSDRLKRHIDSERLAYFGAGTFAALMLPAGLMDEIALHEQITTILRQPFRVDDQELRVTVRSGIARYPENGRDAHELVQNAAAALRRAAVSGQQCLQHRVEMNSEIAAHLTLERQLRNALEQRQFELHYQPKVDAKTRRIQGVEALIRWRDPASGLVAPGVFLPVLESTGMIVEVGEWVLRQAALDCRQWRDSGLASLRVAVNVSPQQLRSRGFEAMFLQIADGWSSPACGLDIEITENALLGDTAEILRMLKTLRSRGVRIAIDDFGTGYSSLSRLADLPIDTLKIDRSFTSRLPDDKAGKVLVATIIALGKAFGMTIVAEGVELQEQLELLAHMGCHQSQGYLHSRAVTRNELTTLLTQGRGPLILPPEALHDSQSHMMRGA